VLVLLNFLSSIQALIIEIIWYHNTPVKRTSLFEVLYNVRTKNILNMGSKIPKSIRKKVLGKWLSGLPRAQIAKQCEIGAGTVSTIIKEYKENDSEFDTIRELAVKLKNENLDLGLFSCIAQI
jgi:hypothetical protein